MRGRTWRGDDGVGVRGNESLKYVVGLSYAKRGVGSYAKGCWTVISNIMKSHPTAGPYVLRFFGEVAGPWNDGRPR